MGGARFASMTSSRVDERSFFVRGWARDQQAPIVRLCAVSPEGSRVEMLERLARLRRPDLDELFSSSESAAFGFVCPLRLDAPSRLGPGWIFELENAAGSAWRSRLPTPIEDPLQRGTPSSRRSSPERSPASPVTGTCSPPWPDSRSALRRWSRSTCGAIRRAARRRSLDCRPVYKRVDLLQHQLAQFASDPELSEAELIYVLDSPELSTPTLAEAHGCSSSTGSPSGSRRSRAMAGSPSPITSAPRSRLAGCCFCSIPTSSPRARVGSAG